MNRTFISTFENKLWISNKCKKNWFQQHHQHILSEVDARGDKEEIRKAMLCCHDTNLGPFV